MKFQALVLFAALFTSATALAVGANSQYFANEQATRESLPFSQAVLTGNTLYVAGQIGIDPKTGQAAQNSETEARLVLDAVKKTVNSAGLTMDDLVSVTVYCTDLGLYDIFNKVYRSYFRGEYPARAFIGVGQLLRSAHFEVQGIAIKSHLRGK